MINEKLELYNNLTNENGFSALFLGKNSKYNEAAQRIYNLHWNSVVTTFDLNNSESEIYEDLFNSIEAYRKVNCIGIVDVEKRKNPFNKRKLIAFSVGACLENSGLIYLPILTKYLLSLRDKLAIGGTLIIDGLTVNEYKKLNLLPYIAGFQKGTISFFRCGNDLQDAIHADLNESQTETISFFSEGIEEYLSEYLEDSNENNYVSENENDVIYYFSGGKKNSFEKKKLIDSSGLLNLVSTEDIDGKKVASFLTEPYFYSFINDSKNSPQWYAYENELTIKRSIEEDLLKRVRSWLNNPGAINKKKKERKKQVLCVSGQSCSGKSVSIAKIAFQIFKEREFPVVFINKHADFSYTSEFDTQTQQVYTKSDNLRILYDFLDKLKDDGAKSVLLVWDLSAYYNDMKKYVELANNLENRNINFTLLCTSYEFNEYFDFEKEYPKIARITLSASLNDEELEDARKVLRKKANMPHDILDKLMQIAGGAESKSNLLELIYFAFNGARGAMAQGIQTEAWIESRDLFDRLLQNKDSFANQNLVKEYEKNKVKTNIQSAFEKAGYNLESKKIEKNNITRLIDLLAFCTQLNKGVPVMLALDCCNLSVSNISLLSELNVIDFVSDDSRDIKLYIRSRIEAEILLGNNENATLRIVELIGELIGTIDRYSNENIILLRDILFNIGPNSSDDDLKSRFNPYLKTILEYLEDFRENGGDPRITLQEITITREYYCKLYNDKEIDVNEIKNAISSSIKIGKRTASDKTIDRSLKNKIMGEVSQQEMLSLSPNDETSFDNLMMGLSAEDLENIMKNMYEAIQYEPDNSYYYVDWMKAALLLLSNNRVSREEKHEIMENVLFIDENLNEEHTEIKRKEHYVNVSSQIREIIYNEGDDYLREQIDRGVPAAGYILAFKEMGNDLSQKLHGSGESKTLSEIEIETLDRICKDYLLRFVETDKKCCKLLIKIKKCIFNNGSWQNLQNNNFIYEEDNAGTTSISKTHWKELCGLCEMYYKNNVDNYSYIRDSYNEIYLFALASAQTNLYTTDNAERIFANSVHLLNKIREDKYVKERQIEGKMDSRQLICDENGRIVLFPGKTTKRKLNQLPVKLDGMRTPIFANIIDLNLPNDIVDDDMRGYFAVSFGYMGLKAHRFDKKKTVKFSDLGRAK